MQLILSETSPDPRDFHGSGYLFCAAIIVEQKYVYYFI